MRTGIRTKCFSGFCFSPRNSSHACYGDFIPAGGGGGGGRHQRVRFIGVFNYCK